jgi:Protein of unknown function (DUF3303)
MLFMVIEHYRNVKAVYARFNQKGRMMPEGMKYVGSWVESNLARCFQLVDAENQSLFSAWTENWKDIVDFEIIPVINSNDAATIVSDGM